MTSMLSEFRVFVFGLISFFPLWIAHAKSPEKSQKEWLVTARSGGLITLAGVRGVSNPEPFVALGLGYCFHKNVSVQIEFLSGFQSGNQVQPAWPPGDYHLDFGISLLNLNIIFGVQNGGDFVFGFRLGGGLARLDPSAVPQQGTQGNMTGGIYLDYAPDSFPLSLGIGTDFYFIVPAGIPSVLLGLRLKQSF
jgi:hypothetical protein